MLELIFQTTLSSNFVSSQGSEFFRPNMNMCSQDKILGTLESTVVFLLWSVHWHEAGNWQISYVNQWFSNCVDPQNHLRIFKTQIPLPCPWVLWFHKFEVAPENLVSIKHSNVWTVREVWEAVVEFDVAVTSHVIIVRYVVGSVSFHSSFHSDFFYL